MLPTAARSTAGSAVRTSTSRVDAALAQPRRRHRPDAPQRVDRQLLQERLDALGRDHRQAVRLAPGRRDLREELVRRDAGRRGQAGRLANPRLDAPARRSSPSGSPHAFSVTSRYASSSDSASTSGVTDAEDREHLLRHRAVLLEIRADDREVRAEADRARHRNRRAHAELARLVAGGRDHAARLRRAADRHRLAAQLRPIALLDRRVERVHVDVDDAAQVMTPM